MPSAFLLRAEGRGPAMPATLLGSGCGNAAPSMSGWKAVFRKAELGFAGRVERRGRERQRLWPV